MAVCVAVIGKDNGPMFFRTRQSSINELQYHFIVSSALDIIEERVQSSNKSILPGGLSNPVASEMTRELYLGVLTAQEDYKVYGYTTNTKIKFVIVIEETSTPLRENDIRMMFRKLHGAFCDLMSNPFYLPGSEIKSKRFNDAVNSIVAGV